MQDTLDYLVQEQCRKRRQTAVFAVLVVLAGGWWALGDRVSALFSGEKNWQGDPVFEAQAPSMLGAVDLRRVHEDLLPNWTVALAWVDRQGPAPATAALQALQAAVASDQNLSELLVEVAERVRGDLWEEGERLIFLTSAWSRYLDAQDAPWRVEGGVVDLGSGPFFYVKVYEILADGAVGVGGQPSRIRLMRRADTLNIYEAHLGHVVEGEDAGMVVLDRIEEFAADALWPLLDPSGQRALDRLGAAHGAAVRAEAASVLPADLSSWVGEDQVSLAATWLRGANRHSRPGGRLDHPLRLAVFDAGDSRRPSVDEPQDTAVSAAGMRARRAHAQAGARAGLRGRCGRGDRPAACPPGTRTSTPWC